MDSRERAALDRYITRDDDSTEEEELTPGEAAEARDAAAEADRLAFAWSLHEQAERGEYTRAQWHAERDLIRAARAYIADAARFGPGDYRSAIALREAVEALDGKEEPEGRDDPEAAAERRYSEQGMAESSSQLPWNGGDAGTF
jgi:hypothetical protein